MLDSNQSNLGRVIEDQEPVMVSTVSWGLDKKKSQILIIFRMSCYRSINLDGVAGAVPT